MVGFTKNQTSAVVMSQERKVSRGSELGFFEIFFRSQRTRGAFFFEAFYVRFNS